MQWSMMMMMMMLSTFGPTVGRFHIPQQQQMLYFLAFMSGRDTIAILLRPVMNNKNMQTMMMTMYF
jgi:hypothetical protein